MHSFKAKTLDSYRSETGNLNAVCREIMEDFLVSSVLSNLID